MYIAYTGTLPCIKKKEDSQRDKTASDSLESRVFRLNIAGLDFLTASLISLNINK